MKATITDVAKHAGVSMKTVSRVLNGEPNVSLKTKEKVEAAASALNYSPNFAARGLASSRSYLIALLSDIPSPGYIMGIQQGAAKACREKGYHLVVQPLDMTDSTLMQNVDGLLRRLPVDGVILTSPLCDSERIIARLIELKIPYVPIAPTRSHAGVPIVCMDDVKASKEMTETLISLGHKNIGFIKGPEAHSASHLRFRGFKQAMSDAGLSINPDWVEQGAFTFKSGVEASEVILNKDSRPSAIFASNDDMAAGVISVANRLGYSLPQDLSVCGFDDTPLAKIISPQLTTVQQPIQDMGYRAAHILIPNTAPESETLTYTLEHAIINRESTCRI